MIHHRVEQGSGEWMKLRIGKPTASNFHKIVTPLGRISKQSRKYAYVLIAERLLNESFDSLETIEHIARGKELEPAAARMYEFQENIQTEKAGLFTTDDGRIGASPDRLLLDKPGAVELKCPTAPVHVGYLIEGFELDYIPQVQGLALVGEFEFVDRFAYYPSWPPVLTRTYRDEGYIKTLSDALNEFCDLKDELLERVLKMGSFDERANLTTALEREYGGSDGFVDRE
jgi:hypothetical protein